MNQTYDNLEEGSEEYKKLFFETKEKLPSLNEETFCSFVKAKKYFSKFKEIENLEDTGLESNGLDLSKTDLKEFTYEENQANVLKAMERLYGESEDKKAESKE